MSLPGIAVTGHHSRAVCLAVSSFSAQQTVTWPIRGLEDGQLRERVDAVLVAPESVAANGDTRAAAGSYAAALLAARILAQAPLAPS